MFTPYYEIPCPNAVEQGFVMFPGQLVRELLAAELKVDQSPITGLAASSLQHLLRSEGLWVLFEDG